MGRVICGDQEAFSRLADIYRPRLERFSLRMLGNADLARDAAQETLLRLWEKAHLYRPRGSFEAFLFTIARNVCLRQAERRRGTVGLEQAHGVAAHGEPEPTIVSQVREALAALPEEQRLALVLSEFENLSYEEIGQIIGCPKGTVGSRKYAAVRALRGMLRDA